ncbi:hypothetical protein ZIOFF_030498 [Zingiber officinale]|uniref:SNARE-complex protein Syntaxin-18 N-terminal domain-containing protein n=1 Tax=Zingiber officinale TaxID=94328 RepID=A0A8J5GPI4_ZINOF|nr:hypothetical protein ZIOFF_030498 [Zingiber officinale]
MNSSAFLSTSFASPPPASWFDVSSVAPPDASATSSLQLSACSFLGLVMSLVASRHSLLLEFFNSSLSLLAIIFGFDVSDENDGEGERCLGEGKVGDAGVEGMMLLPFMPATCSTLFPFDPERDIHGIGEGSTADSFSESNRVLQFAKLAALLASFILRKPLEKPPFEKAAIKTLESISELEHFITKHRKDYVDLHRITEQERDNIEHEVS